MKLKAIAFVLASVMAISSYSEEQKNNGEVRIIFGEKNQVCLDAVSLIRGSNKADFGYDKRPDFFSSKKWSPSEILNHEFTTIDIYNNGTSVVVLADTEMLSSVYSRSLYVMQPEDFLISQKSKLLDRTKIAQLSPANLVVFTNGKIAGPVWSDVWLHGSKSYIVMKEFNFGTEPDDDSPFYNPNPKWKLDSLYISILSPSSKKYDADFKVIRLSPKMVCQIKWK